MGSLTKEQITHLRSRHFVNVSWQDLEIEQDEILHTAILSTVQNKLVHRLSVEGLQGEAKADSDECRQAARAFARPVVHALFPTDAHAQNNWSLFAVNYYEQDTLNPPHLDKNNPDISTTVILSLTGVRILRVEDEATRLHPGTITLLDGGYNPLHSAYCVDGPSISVVADIPQLLY